MNMTVTRLFLIVVAGTMCFGVARLWTSTEAEAGAPLPAEEPVLIEASTELAPGVRGTTCSSCLPIAVPVEGDGQPIRYLSMSWMVTSSAYDWPLTRTYRMPAMRADSADATESGAGGPLDGSMLPEGCELAGKWVDVVARPAGSRTWAEVRSAADVHAGFVVADRSRDFHASASADAATASIGYRCCG